MTTPLRSGLLLVSLVLLAGPAEARRRRSSETPPESFSEFSFGFMGGLRDQSLTGYIVTKDAAATPGAASLLTPFGAAPLTDTLVSGPAWEVRWVNHHVRMTVGVQKPFALFRPGEGAGVYDVDGLPRSVTLRALQLLDLRLGLGGELNLRRVTPFLDLVGDIRFATADLTVDGAAASYKGTGFSYSVRGGVRVMVSDAMFVAVSGEVGLLGGSRYGGQLLVGFLLPMR